MRNLSNSNQNNWKWKTRNVLPLKQGNDRTLHLILHPLKFGLFVRFVACPKFTPKYFVFVFYRIEYTEEENCVRPGKLNQRLFRTAFPPTQNKPCFFLFVYIRNDVYLKHLRNPTLTEPGTYTLVLLLNIKTLIRLLLFNRAVLFSPLLSCQMSTEYDCHL